MAAIAIISRRLENYDRYYEMIEKAYSKQPNDLILIIAISEHYFYKGD